MQVKDLNINTEIFSLFNFTLNEDSKVRVKEMITRIPETEQEIIHRQNILKGFVANINIFESYSYSKIDYREVYHFMQHYTDKVFLPKRLKLKLLFSKRKFHLFRGNCVQTILLYNRLHNLYIKNINLSLFPEAYKNDIRLIDTFFNTLRLDYYENLIRENNFKAKEIKEFITLISEKKKREEIHAFQKIFTQFEAYISIARGVTFYKLNFPEITDNNFTINNFYHPLLQKPVKNSFIAASNTTLLTGPNMSGKSTLLKAISICVYLANIGFAIPAKSAQIPKYDKIAVFINLNDDLQSGYSHFMTEVINLKKVIQNSNNKKCFAVFDELFRGTNIDDALEISSTTLQGMLKFPESTFLVSSHLHKLVELPEIKNNKIACCYLDCSLSDNLPKFTYLLKSGCSDIKIGRILFEKEGLNELLLKESIKN